VLNRSITGLRGRTSSDLASRYLAVGLVAGLIAVAGTTTGEGAFAQAAGGEPVGGAKRVDTNADILEDFIHYTFIQNYDLAAAKGNELIGRGLSNADFVQLVEGGDVGRFVETVQRALRVQKLEPIAAKLQLAFDQGRLERVRNPEYITAAINGLTGNARTRLLSREQLLTAGEYAMPQLLENFLNPSKPQLQAEVQRVMIDLGRQAIMPLAAAMMKLPVQQQEQIADVLGLIQYRTSLPFLSDLAETTQSDSVRVACNRAIERLGGAAGTTASMYRSLADAYYMDQKEVTSFPGEDHQILWGFAPGAGLLMTAIRTPVYHEAMAMTLLERAMEVEGGAGGVSPETLSLWVAANFSRETDTPDDYVNPAYPVTGAAEPGQKARRGAMYFAVAAGAEISQRVLARAISDRDTPLARQALAAVEKTAGAGAINQNPGFNPLLEAITYPNRRVQYEAALAIANSQPAQSFAGADRVVPTLASTIRGATEQFALVVTTNTEAYQVLRTHLSSMGYTVLPQGRTLRDLEAPIAESAAVDLIVGSGMTGESVPAFIEEVRTWNKIAATPVMMLTSPESYTELRRRYDTDSTVAIRQVGIPDTAIRETVTQLVESASGGPITQEEASDYSSRALAALRDLAVSQSQVLNVGDAALPLIGALADKTSANRMQIADILARIPQDRAQRAVMDAAIEASGEERVALLGLVSESAKRYGNLLERRHIGRLVEIAGQGDDQEATAAASLMGALNLPNTELVPLILTK
jgi:hypothetical protein